MDERNGCFDHHGDLFDQLGSDSDCLKDFILDPVNVPPLMPPQQHMQNISWNNGQMHYPHSLPQVVDPVLNLPQGLPVSSIHESAIPPLHESSVSHVNNSVVPTIHNRIGPPPIHNSAIPSIHNIIPHINNNVVPSVHTSAVHNNIGHPLQESGISAIHDSGLNVPSDSGVAPQEPSLPQHQDHGYPTEMETVPVTNGDCWSPAGFVGASPAGFTTASASERTVSSDCVSSETMCSPSEGTSDSPTTCKVATTSGEVPETSKKRGRKKKKEEKKRSTTVATYHSQISPEQNGIILKIRKSMTEVPQKSRKKRKEKDVYCDDDDLVEPEVQSGWGSSMPKLVLHKIFQLVTRTEGCVPFLVR